MRNILLALAMAVTGSVAFGAQINPGTTQFPWMNGPQRDSVYRMVDHTNAVTVIEAYSVSCPACNENAPQVEALAASYSDNDRVQFLDMGLDSSSRDYQTWISRYHPTYPVVKDQNRAVWQALSQEPYIPQTLVLDCQGNLIDYTVGTWDAAAKAKLQAAIETASTVNCQ